MKNEVLRRITFETIAKAEVYFDRLSEERLGKLFKTRDAVFVPSASAKREYAFQITDDEYLGKASLLNSLVEDLFRAGAAGVFICKIVFNCQDS